MPPTQRRATAPPTNGTPATLAEALAQLQTELPTISKDQTATVPTKSGGQYSYKYAGLPTVSEEVLPLLGKLGLSFSAKPTWTTDSGFVLRYILRHVGGETDGGDWPLPDPTSNLATVVGSAITYARRYTLCAITGVVTDEDDDAQAVGNATASRTRGRPAGYDDSPPPTGEPSRTAEQWVLLAIDAAEAKDLDKLLSIGRECNAAGMFVGETKKAMLALRDKLQGESTTAPGAEPPQEPKQ